MNARLLLTTLAIGLPLSSFAQDRILFIRGGNGSVGFFEGGSNEQGASIRNFIDNRKNHGWGELATALESEGFILEEVSEDSPAGVGKTPVPLETLTLSDYAIIVFGSNNAEYAPAAINAVTSYVENGGAALFISDANFGSNWADAASSDSQFLAPFGLLTNQDNGTYSLDRDNNAANDNLPGQDGDFLIANHPVFLGVDRFDGEGVSPGTVDASVAANLPIGINSVSGFSPTILSKLADGRGLRINPSPPFSGNQGGTRSQTANDGTLIISESTATGAGRIALHFDRNTFFNLVGAGTNINRLDNERYARNLFHWLADTTPASNPAPRAHLQGIDGISIAAGEEIIFTAKASDLNGSIASVELIINGNSAGIDSASPYQWSTDALIAGENILTLRSTDNQGAVTDNPRSIILEDPSLLGIPLDRSDWTLESNFNNVQTGADNLANAIDGNPGSRWATRSAQAPGMTFQIDFGQPAFFDQIVMDTTGNANDYPRGYIVRGSHDGTTFSNLITNPTNSSDAITTIQLPNAVTYRYLEIEQTGSSTNNWWSIHEINLFAPSPGIPLPKASWLEKFFSDELDTPANEASTYGDLADFDNDGLNNLLEFAFNTDPTIANTINPVAVALVEDGVFHLTFPRWIGGNGLTYVVETSTDLSGWDPLGTLTSEPSAPTDQNDGTELATVRASFPNGTPKAFVRVRVSD